MAEAAAEQTSGERPGRATAERQIERFSELADGLLSRADLTAKAAAGLGSSGLTAIGIAKVADVYPFEGPDGWLFGLFGGFLTMGLALAFFTRRLWRLQSPTVMRSTPWEIRDLDDEEEQLVAEVFAEIAKLNDVASLRAYEARAHRLSRVADLVGETPLGKALAAEASLIALEVRATLARARLNVVRRRTTRSILGFRAMLVYFAFLVGLVLFGVAADALEAKRSGEVQVAKACGDALKAGASSLPSGCDDYVSADSGGEDDTAAPGDEIDTAAEELAAQRTACRRAAREAGEDPSALCAPIDSALAVLTGTR
jgi:hypothetical protein